MPRQQVEALTPTEAKSTIDTLSEEGKAKIGRLVAQVAAEEAKQAAGPADAATVAAAYDGLPDAAKRRVEELVDRLTARAARESG